MVVKPHFLWMLWYVCSYNIYLLFWFITVRKQKDKQESREHIKHAEASSRKREQSATRNVEGRTGKKKSYQDGDDLAVQHLAAANLDGTTSVVKYQLEIDAQKPEGAEHGNDKVEPARLTGEYGYESEQSSTRSSIRSKRGHVQTDDGSNEVSGHELTAEGSESTATAREQASVTSYDNFAGKSCADWGSDESESVNRLDNTVSSRGISKQESRSDFYEDSTASLESSATTYSIYPDLQPNSESEQNDDSEVWNGPSTDGDMCHGAIELEMEKPSLASNENMPDFVDEVDDTSAQLDASSSKDTLLHAMSEMENTLNNRESVDESGTVVTNESVVADANAMVEKIGSESTSSAREEMTVIVAQREYSFKEVVASSDGSCTEDSTAFSPAGKCPDSISTPTKKGFIGSLMDVGFEGTNTQEALPAPKPYMTGNDLDCDSLCSSCWVSTSSFSDYNELIGGIVQDDGETAASKAKPQPGSEKVDTQKRVTKKKEKIKKAPWR